MKTVKFLGPTDVLIVDGQEIPRGKTAEVSDEAAAQLKSFDRVEVQVTDASVSGRNERATKANDKTKEKAHGSV